MKYYTINEKAAKEAKSLWSFSDYEEESKTREYQSQVDEVYTIVSELPEELQEKGEALADAYAKKLADWYQSAKKLADWYNKQFKIESMHPSVMISGAGHFNVQKADAYAKKLADWYQSAKKLADWYNKQFKIESMHSSVMISGAGHFNVQKKEKQNQAQSKHYAEYDNIQSILYKIKNLPKTAKIIKSGDADAVEKLKAKIEKLEADQTEMKEINAYYRKYKTMKGYANLTDEKAKEYDKAIEESWYKVPYARFELTNNNAKIRNVKERLASLEKVKATAEENNDEEKFSDLPFTVVRNTEIMRLQLFFEGKPSAEIREVLKKNGFRFAPSQNNAWQRHLNNNGLYALKRVAQTLREC